MKNDFIYSITEDNDKDRHEFDLNDLGVSVYRGMSVGLIYEDGRIEGGDIWNSPPEQGDYDRKFQKALLKLNPVYKIPDFLEYHHKKYCSNGVSLDFVKHIRYVILAYFIQINKKAIVELINNWLTKTEKMNLLKLEEEKINFLRKAYEAAKEHSPTNPYSVSINTQEFGDYLVLSAQKTKELLVELVYDKYLSSTLGARSFMIQKEGYRFLVSLESYEKEKKAESSINITGSKGSNINIQQNNSNSNQSITVLDFSIEDVKKLLVDIEKNQKKLELHLSQEQKEELEEDIIRLGKQLSKSTQDKGKVKRILNEVGIILKEVPTNILSSIFSNYALDFLGLV